MQSYPTLLIKSGRITIASVPSGFCSVLFASVTRLLSISHQRWIIYIAVWILFIEFITIVSAFCSVTFASVTHSSSNQRLKTYHVATCILCIELFTLTLVPSVICCNLGNHSNHHSRLRPIRILQYCSRRCCCHTIHLQSSMDDL